MFHNYKPRARRKEKNGVMIRLQLDGKVSPFSLLRLCKINSTDIELRSEPDAVYQLCQIKPVERHDKVALIKIFSHKP